MARHAPTKVAAEVHERVDVAAGQSFTASFAPPLAVSGRVPLAPGLAFGGSIPIQAKLEVGASDDPAEAEADAVAEQVLARLRGLEDGGTGQERPSSGITALRRSHAAGGAAGGELDSAAESAITGLRGKGSPIPAGILGPLQNAFGADLSGVRLHSGTQARSLNEGLGSLAFTSRNDIVFRDGIPSTGDERGLRLMAHELTHVVQQDGGVRRAAGQNLVQLKRTALTSKEVMTIVGRIPQLKQKFGDESQSPSLLEKHTLEQRIDESLHAYKNHIAKKKDEDIDVRDAMMLSMALGGIASAFAEQINDPSAIAEVMSALMAAFETEVGNSLKKEKRSLRNSAKSFDRVMKLTGAMMQGDPVKQYMHREIGVAKAAKQIVSMARAAGDPKIDAEAMLGLMTERFEAEMSTYTEKQRKGSEYDQGFGFNLSESYGIYSKNFFDRTFELSGTTKDVQWESGGKGEGESLKLTEDAEKMLADLRAAVKQAEAARPRVVNFKGRQVDPNDPNSGNLTEGQEEHLSTLEQTEKGMDLAKPEERFVAVLSERYLKTKDEAGVLAERIKTYVREEMPLTLTVNMARWFGDDTTQRTPDRAKGETTFTPATAGTQTTDVSTLFGKQPQQQQVLTHLQTWDDKGPGGARGARYLRFRKWKDQLMTGLQDLTKQEMPTFGAGNVTWESNRGGQSEFAEKHATNYYGDLHFVLDPAKIRHRMVFTARDHGEPRRDPFLGLLDLIGISPDSKGTGRTQLKDVEYAAVLDNLVNAIGAKIPIVGLGLVFEFQVFGRVDILKEVKEVYVPPIHSDTIFNHVQQFYQGSGVTVVRMKPPVEDQIPGGDGDQMGNLDKGLLQQIVFGKDTSQESTDLMKRVQAPAKGVDGTKKTSGDQALGNLKYERMPYFAAVAGAVAAADVLLSSCTMLQDFPEAVNEADLKTLKEMEKRLRVFDSPVKKNPGYNNPDYKAILDEAIALYDRALVAMKALVDAIEEAKAQPVQPQDEGELVEAH
ncbi:MAG TPA: DUF4157 domain-containing protein [Jatrophihabitans sp.]|jgi:hypothetical protein